MNSKELCLHGMNPRTDAAVCPHCGEDAGSRRRPQDIRPGVRLKDRYLIGSSLRCAKHTITYIAYDLNRGQKVTVTEYFPSGRAARGLNGISVITCPIEIPHGIQEQGTDGSDFLPFALFEENGTVYTVTEEVGGANLEEILRLTGGRVSFEKTVHLFRPVMRAVEAIHAAGAAYGPVDVRHILVTKDGRGMLVGFGEIVLDALAEWMEDGAGCCKGEQSADIRRLAASMCQVLSGVVPDISAAAGTERPLVYDVYGFRIPASVENAIVSAMNPEAAFPFASMREFESACFLDTKREKAVRPTARIKLRNIFLPFGR